MSKLVDALTVLEAEIAAFVVVDAAAQAHEAAIGTAALAAMTDAELDAIDRSIGHTVAVEAVRAAELAVVRAYLPLSEARKRRGEAGQVLAEAARDWKFRRFLVNKAATLAA